MPPCRFFVKAPGSFRRPKIVPLRGFQLRTEVNCPGVESGYAFIRRMPFTSWSGPPDGGPAAPRLQAGGTVSLSGQIAGEKTQVSALRPDCYLPAALLQPSGSSVGSDSLRRCQAQFNSPPDRCVRLLPGFTGVKLPEEWVVVCSAGGLPIGFPGGYPWQRLRRTPRFPTVVARFRAVAVFPRAALRLTD